MTISCAAFNCTVRYKEKKSGVSFHRFPKDKTIRRKWVAALRRKNYIPSNYATVCSNHFRDEDYYLSGKGTKLLKKGVVPSVFNFHEDSEHLKCGPKKILASNFIFKENTPCSSQAVYINKELQGVNVSNIPTEVPKESTVFERDCTPNKFIIRKRFPSNLNIAQLWCESLQLEVDNLRKCLICSDHFSPDDVYKLGSKNFIRKGAIPCLRVQDPVPSANGKVMKRSMDSKPLDQTKLIHDVEESQQQFVKSSSANPRLIHVLPTQDPRSAKLLEESSDALVSSQGAHQTFVIPSTADNPVTTPIIIIPQVSGAISSDTLVLPQNFGKNNLILTPLSSVASNSNQQASIQQFGIGTTSQLVKLASATTTPVRYVDTSMLGQLDNSYTDSVSNNISEKTNKGMEMRCRTCLHPVPNHLEQASMSMTCFEGKSVKESLVQLLPKMTSSLVDDHFVCANCFISLRNALGFVKKCLETESVIAEELKINSGNDSLEKDVKQQFTNTELLLSDTTINERNEFQDNEYEIEEDINFDEDISFDEKEEDDDDDDHEEEDSSFECDIDVEEHDYVLNGITNLIKANEGNKYKKFDKKQSDLCNNVIKYLKFLPLEYAKVGDHDRIVSIPNLEPEFVYSLQKNKINFLQNCAKFDENVFKNKRVLLIGSHTKIKCLLCEEHFNTEEEMRVHISDVHGFTRAFILDTHYYQYLPGSSIYCEACGKNCRTVASKKVHLKNCYVLPCPYCDKMFAPFQMRKHTLEQHNDPKPFKCFYCKQEKNSFMSFKSHLCEILNCETCGKDFENKNSLRIHKKKCCPEDVTTKRCSECKLRFSLSSFQSHVKTHEFPCSICGKIMPNRRVLYKHEYHHSVKKGSLCPFCGKLVSYLPKHIKMHKDEQLQGFTCSLCSKTFISKSNLNRHVKLYHMTTRIVCEKCGKIFSEYYLENHYKSEHPNEKVFKCAKCESSFTMIAYLKQHAKSHAIEVKKEHDMNKKNEKPKRNREFRSKERRVYRHTDLFKKVKSKMKGLDAPITCKHCLKTLKDLYQYRNHLETHVALYRFKCRFCEMTYSSARNKDRHEKLHEDPNYKFRCGECWKVMKSQEELDDHMEHHASKPKRYQCGDCFELFSREYQLRSHIVNKHTVEGEVEEAKEDVIIDALMDFAV
nr:zinc finger protein 14-like [Leptinotarsa decemlineata]